jgi:5-methylcytosine-specific restriction endonuclease McrA
MGVVKVRLEKPGDHDTEDARYIGDVGQHYLREQRLIRAKGTDLSKVFVLDTNRQPVDPVRPVRARILLTTGRAAVFRRYPFTIILKGAGAQPKVSPLRLKIDPGSQVTGLAIVNDASGEVVFAAELTHRGQEIKKRLAQRRASRRSRRQRHTRNRKPRFDNRRNTKKGWLAPSLESRVCNVITWVKRLMHVCPLAALSLELVRYDMQQMENPDISGVGYQQGTLQGYEVREYLLEKWNRMCAYCGRREIPLQVEHICPRAKNGSNRISNLTLACEPCNNKKGTQEIQVFLAKQPEVLKRIMAQAKAPLIDAAAVNVTRWALSERLSALGLPLEWGTGGRTKYNRVTRGLEKAHWLDAACVGASTPEHLSIKGIAPLLITANGRGCRQMCLMDKRGFPRTGPKQAKVVKGFQTGDMVKAVVAKGVNSGTYVGRVAVRATGSFNIMTNQGKMVEGISHRSCTALHKGDGYSYR